VGKDVPVTIMRKGKEMTRTVKLGRLEDGEKLQQASASTPAKPGQPAAPATTSALGLELSAVTDELKRRYSIKDGAKGVVITKVDPNSSAADKRIQAGEMILEVGQEAVNSPADIAKRIEALKKENRKNVLLLVANARGEERFVAVTIN
jgi:serine protease Do